MSAPADARMVNGQASDAGADHDRPVRVRARQVRARYGWDGRKAPLVLDGIDLTIVDGEFVSIVGPSGCGKTTFLNAVDGLLPLVGGAIEIDDTAVTTPGPDRAMVFQDPSLLPWRTVAGNIAWGLELRRKRRDKAVIGQRVQELVDLVGLTGFEDHYPRQLSGGMKQRVNLARALATDPAVLLLDEPFAALDAQTREYMQAELIGIWARANKTALFITHQIDEAIYLSDRVVVFGARPARVKADIRIDLPRPRELGLKKTPEFHAYEDEIWRLIQEEARAGRPAAPDAETERIR
ncbi:MAG TPA: ABC transporter ATP-binding protein [Acidimicrobiales bacterium]